MKKRRRKLKPIPASKAELEEFKVFLGPLSADYTEVELYQLRREMQAMAGILLDIYWAKKSGQDLPDIEF